MAHGSHDTESVYDFIYLDRDRLASFSAQIFDHGVLTSVKTDDKGTNQVASEMTSGPKAIFQATERESQTNLQGVERQFDAAWALPLNVLNRLDELHLIKRSLAEASLGELVLFSGFVNIIDLGIAKDLWEPVLALEQIKEEQPKTSAQRKRFQITKTQTKAVIDIVKKLPHSVQLRVFNGDEQAWSTLRREFLTVNSEDFPLKYGPSIEGTWHCLAVLDAKPSADEDEGIKLPEGASEMEIGMWNLFLQMRVMLGRRFTDYGITPIAVFRKCN